MNEESEHRFGHSPKRVEAEASAEEKSLAERSDRVSMARKPRRKFRRYIRGNIDERQALATLAAATGVKNSIDDSVDDSTWASSVEALWSVTGITDGDNIGPIMVGYAHSDYTLAEIEEWIERSVSWSEANLIEREISQRKIKRIGMFRNPDTPGQAALLNEGRMVKTKLGWVLNEGQTIALWYYNVGTAAFASSIPDVHTQGHVNLWPM